MKKKEKKEKPAHLVARAQSRFEVYTVKEAAELMDFLMKIKEGISRTTAKSLLSNRLVHVNHVITTQYNFPLQPGMKVQINKGKGKKEFQSRYLKVIYEDAYLMVVDKKDGILTIGTEKQKEQTAYSLLNEYVKRSGKHHRVFIVNKLDKDASGLLFFAKDEKTRNTLQDYWNETVKDYRFVAVLSGETEKDSGCVCSWAIDGKVYVSHVPLSNKNSEKAITHYKTIKRANGYSLVELGLETGRKNQIRLHMHELGHPILGDIKYQEDESCPIQRLALHAFQLGFYHPVTRQFIEFKTPYPPEFKKLMLKKVD